MQSSFHPSPFTPENEGLNVAIGEVHNRNLIRRKPLLEEWERKREESRVIGSRSSFIRVTLKPYPSTIPIPPASSWKHLIPPSHPSPQSLSSPSSPFVISPDSSFADSDTSLSPSTRSTRLPPPYPCPPFSFFLYNDGPAVSISRLEKTSDGGDGSASAGTTSKCKIRFRSRVVTRRSHAQIWCDADKVCLLPLFLPSPSLSSFLR